MLITLPHSKLLFRYSHIMTLNPDGTSNEEEGTTPDIPLSDEEDALTKVVEQAHSISDEELLAIVAISFGIQRVTSNIQKVLKRQLRKLIDNGALSSAGNVLTLTR